jgi:adenylate cyclase
MSIWIGEIKELEKLYDSFKSHLPDIEKELEQLIRTQDANVVMLYSRRCLEVIITDLCENVLKRPRKTEPLKGIIDKLNSDEKVPSHIITSMHSLNNMSTYGTHPKEFDPDQVKPVLNNLAIIIKWYLKYKDFKITSKTKEGEEKFENINYDGSAKVKSKPIKRSLLIYTSLIFILIVVLVVVVLNLPGKKSGDITKLEKSIAVLPFKNLSSDPEQDYFSDGMMDEILDRLFKIGDMKVISRTSSMRFKNSDLSLKEIARQLDVSAILEGSVRKAGNAVRITVQLIDAGTDTHLWSEKYDIDMSDLSRIFLIQSDVAQSVARELKAVLSPRELKLIEKTPTSNLVAYEYYLQGMYYLERHTQEDYDAALQYFEKAKEEDPEYATVYAGISLIWLNRAIWGYSESVEAASKAIAASNKAIELDSTALLAYAGIQRYFKWDWKGAELSYKKYNTFYPNDARGRVQYANLLTLLGRFKEAKEQNELALKLDPLNIGVKGIFGYNLFIAGKYNDAIEKWNDILKINPGNMIALSNLPVALHLIGKYSEELDAWKSYLVINYKDFIKEKEIKHVIDSGYTGGGLRGSLNLLADTLVACSKTHYILPWDIACIYACADSYVRALDMLESCYDMHDLNILWAVTYPVFDKLHNEPRFQEIARKMNLQNK